jgi:squalene-hopene/tetraprenyl-beta-curcumene cyclase
MIAEAADALARNQADDGHWVYELESDATIPAEYILYEHYLDEIDEELESRIATYLREIQGSHGGWPLFHDGDVDVSATVKAYYALKLAGDDIEAPHMKRAREAVLAQGGAERSNVFTRITLALFEQVPWRGVPVIPVEVVHLPKWFPFHLNKISYWARTVMTPLLVVAALRPKAKNPRGFGVSELFVTPPDEVKKYNINPTGSAWGEFFLGVDRLLRMVEPHFPKNTRRRAIDKAIAFITERLNGEDGLGSIFPAMVNAVYAFEALGYAKDHPDLVTAKGAVRKLITPRGNGAYVQPCLSPVWDTGLAAHAMLEAGKAYAPNVARSLEWLKGLQILDLHGDWKVWRPDARPGGWAFQYRNDYYPDVDDTAVVAMAMQRQGDPAYREAISRAAEWVLAMQSENGGWGAFDADNEYYVLNHIPFSDHGALLDPPTLDVSARCIGMLAQLGYGRDHPAMAKGLAYMRSEQEADGSWFGRWGTNYIYGTWSALNAFNIVGEDRDAPHIRKAVRWLNSRQREDGGWGEDAASYWPDRKDECKASTPSQTAWALLALMAAGEARGEAVKRGVEYLLQAPRANGKWEEKYYNAVGFPRVFYLLYHGYSAYFPLWALARYRNLVQGNQSTTPYGI